MTSNNPAGLCVPETFSSISLPGAKILSTQANLVTDFTAESPGLLRMTQPSTSLVDATFCNVTVSYTHPGQNDEIYVETWLPISSSSSSGTAPKNNILHNDNVSGAGPNLSLSTPGSFSALDGSWNGRLQAVGGAGMVAGRSSISYSAMYGALADGYATMTADAGLPQGVPDGGSANSWALLSPGNVNLYKLQNLASVSLDDSAKIAKSVISAFFNSPPKYSYFNGCSQGGRQAMMLAQRYPDAYDGIIAGAPGIYWTELLPFFYLPQHVMNMAGEYPYMCEMDAIDAAAVKACDALDGVVDGVVSHPEECLGVFDPVSTVGRVAEECSGGTADTANNTLKVSETAAKVVKAMWQGIADMASSKNDTAAAIFPGLFPAADVTGNNPFSLGIVGLAATTCQTPFSPSTSSGWDSGVDCRGKANQDSVDWLKLFVAKDPDSNLETLSREGWEKLVRKSGREFRSIIGTEDADLSEFRDRGGKFMSFHGLADNMVPPLATQTYYKKVLSLDPSARDTFFRHFEIPGMGHCLGGRSSQPDTMFDQLRGWVERGEVPEKSPVVVTDLNGGKQERIICAWPKKPVFIGGGDGGCGDSGRRECWRCE